MNLEGYSKSAVALFFWFHLAPCRPTLSRCVPWVGDQSDFSVAAQLIIQFTDNKK